MSRGILLVTGLVVFSAVLGQGQTTTPPTTTPVNEPFGGPILVTPSVGFPNHVPSAGISDAGRAGISNVTSGIETINVPASPATVVTTPSASLSEPTNTPGASLPESTNQALANDLGTSTSVVGASDESGRSTISLAEVSNRYKAEKGTRNARVLSNDDVQTMLNNKGGVTMAKNMPPLGPGALEQGAQTQNAGVQTGAAAAATQPVQQNAQANAQTSQARQSNTPSQAAENATTPQINQNQQSNDAQGSRRLPTTATFLPLLGLLGLVSGGIGLWFRKFRN